jgi:hypothetical protein
MLNRGNKPKDLLKTQHLAILGAKNKLKTNSILSVKSADQKAGFRTQDKERPDHRGSGLGPGGWWRKSRCRVPGVRDKKSRSKLLGSR